MTFSYTVIFLLIISKFILLGLKWSAFENSSELSLGVTNYADSVKFKGTPECEEINKHLPKDVNLMMQVYELPLYDLGKHSELIFIEACVNNLI